MLSTQSINNIRNLYKTIDTGRLPMFATKLSINVLKSLFGIKMIRSKYGFLNKDALVRNGLIALTDIKYLKAIEKSNSSEKIFEIINKCHSKTFLSAYTFYKAMVSNITPYYLDENNTSNKKYEHNEKLIEDVLCGSYDYGYFSKMQIDNLGKIIQDGNVKGEIK